MAKILIHGEWYDAIASGAYWESEFEKLVNAQAELLYPEYRLVEFKCDVESEFGVAKPDFALIEKGYRRWWVLEAELAHHSLHSHVLPQVQKLAAGVYATRHVEYLNSRRYDLDPVALTNMMKGAQPRVLVVVNSPRPEWVQPLAKFDAILEVVEIFRSGRNQHVLRVNGAYPSAPPDALSLCRWDPLIKRFLLVESPAALGPPDGVTYEIEFDGAVTEWTRVESRDRVWLNPIKGNSLPLKATFELASEAGKLVLRVSK